MGKIKVDVEPYLRKAIIQALADMIPVRYRMGVILRLLRMDTCARSEIFTNFGERAYIVRDAEAAQESREEASWEDITGDCLTELEDLPAAKGEIDR